MADQVDYSGEVEALAEHLRSRGLVPTEMVPLLAISAGFIIGGDQSDRARREEWLRLAESWMREGCASGARLRASSENETPHHSDGA